MPDFNLTPGQSHMLTAFIGEEKWKFEKARQTKKAQYKKERYLKKNVINLSPDELVKLQGEIKTLSDEFDAYRVDWMGAKVTKGLSSRVAHQTHIEIPQAEASAQSIEGHASTAEEHQAAEENENTRADDCIPAAEEIARATSSVALEENVRTTES